MAKLQVAPRRSPSPLIGELREKLQRAGKRASAAKAELTKTYSAPIVIGIQVAATTGGAVAGAVMVPLGNGMLGRGVAAGVGIGLVLLGAFGLKGAGGAAVAATGGGMLAKVAGDMSEDGLAGILGGGQ